MSDPSSLTIKIESMPCCASTESSPLIPREVPTHILFYLLLIFFTHTIPVQKSDHILPPTASKSIKGISSPGQLQQPSNWSPCFPGSSQSILTWQLGESSLKPFVSFPWGSKSLSGSNLTQSKCQSSDSRLPDPTHFVPSFLSDAI